MLACLLSFVLGGNGVDHRKVVRFLYDDIYHTGLSIVLYKVLCDDHTSCLSSWPGLDKHVIMDLKP